MAKNRYYAIDAGGEKRIFESWDECQRFRDQNPRGAQYKGFPTRYEAEKYLGLNAKTAPKYYAVKVGRQTGIFDSWAKCQEQVADYPDAVYRKFPDEDMARRWLSANDKPGSRVKAIAYTDGSFNIDAAIWGYGVYLFDADDPSQRFEYSGSGQKYITARNVAGEIFGAIRAVREAIGLGYKQVVLRYDYEGIEAWATGRWAARKSMTVWYKKTLEELKQQIDISFEKVAAHTGERYNEIVDGIAKRAAGI